MKSVYLIESIESKDPETVNRWHNRCVGKRCTVEFVEIDHEMQMRVENLKYSGGWTWFHTSPVVSIREDGGCLRVETWNSVYTLRGLSE